MVTLKLKCERFGNFETEDENKTAKRAEKTSFESDREHFRFLNLF